MPDKLPYYDIDKALNEMVAMVTAGDPVEFLIFAKQYFLDGHRYHEGTLQISHEFGRDLQATASGLTFQVSLQFRRAPVSVINANRSATWLIRSEPLQDGRPTVEGLPGDLLQPPLYLMELLVNSPDVVQIGIVRFSEHSDEYKAEAFYLSSRRMTRLVWSGGDPSENVWP